MEADKTIQDAWCIIHQFLNFHIRCKHCEQFLIYSQCNIVTIQWQFQSFTWVPFAIVNFQLWKLMARHKQPLPFVRTVAAIYRQKANISNVTFKGKWIVIHNVQSHDKNAYSQACVNIFCACCANNHKTVVCFVEQGVILFT